MVIDSTFWVAVSFVIFFGGLIYLRVPHKINEILNRIQYNSCRFDEIFELNPISQSFKICEIFGQNPIFHNYKIGKIFD